MKTTLTITEYSLTKEVWGLKKYQRIPQNVYEWLIRQRK